jgi:hypothetical protein
VGTPHDLNVLYNTMYIRLSMKGPSSIPGQKYKLSFNEVIIENDHKSLIDYLLGPTGSK